MDIVPILLQLVLVAFLIFMNGFFVAAEFACVKIRSSRLETLIAEGSRRAVYAKRLLGFPHNRYKQGISLSNHYNEI